MGRVINTEGPGKTRNQHMRTIAEILRHLSTKPEIDPEAKDMVAHLVYCLRGVYETIEHSAQVWEDRDYWVKAEEFRQAWRWVFKLSGEVEYLVRNDEWNNLPAIMATLFQHVGDIKVAKLTRSSDTWAGAYEKLRAETP